MLRRTGHIFASSTIDKRVTLTFILDLFTYDARGAALNYKVISHLRNQATICSRVMHRLTAPKGAPA